MFTMKAIGVGLVLLGALIFALFILSGIVFALVKGVAKRPRKPHSN